MSRTCGGAEQENSETQVALTRIDRIDSYRSRHLMKADRDLLYAANEEVQQ